MHIDDRRMHAAVVVDDSSSLCIDDPSMRGDNSFPFVDARRRTVDAHVCRRYASTILSLCSDDSWPPCIDEGRCPCIDEGRRRASTKARRCSPRNHVIYILIAPFDPARTWTAEVFQFNDHQI
jgi:hypothetical protein